MNATPEQMLVASELASSRAMAALALSHLAQAQTVGSLVPGLNLAPVNLAAHHLREAAQLLDKSLGAAPSLPLLPSVEEIPAPAPSGNLCISAKSVDEPSLSLSPEPLSETQP